MAKKSKNYSRTQYDQNKISGVEKNLKELILSMSDELNKLRPKARLAEEVVIRFLETADPVVKQFVTECLVAADVKVQIILK